MYTYIYIYAYIQISCIYKYTAADRIIGEKKGSKNTGADGKKEEIFFALTFFYN